MLRFLVFLISLTVSFVPIASATEAGWALLRNGGQVVLLVHANAPGSGDPANFDIDNCRTQRNLSDRGRQQARRIGALFAARAEPVGQVHASRYCRTLETGRLAFGNGLVDAWEPLDPFSADEEHAAEQREAIVGLVRDYSDSGNLVLVTHQSVVAALTGVNPREGEAVIVAPSGEGLQAIGRIVFN